MSVREALKGVRKAMEDIRKDISDTRSEVRETAKTARPKPVRNFFRRRRPRDRLIRRLRRKVVE